MNASRKEILFLLSVASISLIALKFPGVYSVAPGEINIHNIKIAGAGDLKYELISGKENDQIVFRGGYPYLTGEAENHSDFYNGNINFIRTSVYWQTPVNPSSSLLKAEKTPGGYLVRLMLEKRNELPVVSIICNPADFFSYNQGIYVEGMDADFISAKRFYPMPWHKPANYFRNAEDERKVHFTLYDENGRVNLSTYALAEINGNATRCFPQKSVRLSASRDIGDKKFKCDFFGTNAYYETLVLRNGGNDNTKALFRDMLMQGLMQNIGLLVSGFLPCEVYLNGEYWGIHFIQNRMDADFVARKYGEKEKNITIIEDWKLDKGEEKQHENLMKALSGGSKKLTYELVSGCIDENDLINYLIGEIYFANTDWPENNLKMYKVHGKTETKWKFAFFDLDYGFGYTGVESAVNYDMFAHLNGKNDLFSSIFKAVMRNTGFRQKFKSRFEEMMKHELSEVRMMQRISELEKRIENSVEKHTQRWQKPVDVNEWREAVDELRTFAASRNRIVRSQIQKYLK